LGVRYARRAVRLQLKLTVLLVLIGVLLILLYKVLYSKPLLIGGAVIMILSPYLSNIIVLRKLKSL
jgi:hypothetical protein